MCFKKKKNKEKKIKPHGASNFAGSFSIFAGVMGILASLLLFVVYFLWGDSFLNSIFGINEGLLVLLFPFILIGVIFWALFKLIFGGFMLSYLWISVILFFVAGGMMKTASANLGNIYSNKSNRRKAITSMVLWWVILALLGLGVFMTTKAVGTISNEPEVFKMISFGCIAVFALLSLICFVVTVIDFARKSKRVKYNEQGQMIDDTFVSSVTFFGNQTNEQVDTNDVGEMKCNFCGGSIDSNVQFCPHCGGKNENRQLKVGDITEKGKVIGFDLKTKEPKFMPIDDNTSSINTKK